MRCMSMARSARLIAGSAVVDAVGAGAGSGAPCVISRMASAAQSGSATAAAAFAARDFDLPAMASLIIVIGLQLTIVVCLALLTFIWTVLKVQIVRMTRCPFLFEARHTESDRLTGIHRTRLHISYILRACQPN